MDLVRKLYEIFFQDSSHYAKAKEDPSGSFEYNPVKGVPTLEIIQQHIDCELTLGAYTVSPGNTIRWLCWDIDSKESLEKAREIAKKVSDFLTEKGIPHAIEFSGNKGYHGYLFFRIQENAARGKMLGEKLRDHFGFASSGKTHVEVFPKQGEVKDGKIGNLLRLPLGRHPGTKKQAFFVDTVNWEEGDPLDPMEVFERVCSLDDLEAALASLRPIDEIAAILAPYWKTGQRHNITLCTAGMAATSGWTQEATEELVTLIHEKVPEGELADQLGTVESTYRKYVAGDKILGENGLAHFIPLVVLIKVRSLMGASASSLILQTIDSIRLEKKAAFQKVRNAAHAIIGYLRENGRLVRDENNNVYWLNQEDHQLTMLDSYGWQRLAHNLLGINQAESFGRQLAEAIRHRAYDAAELVKVARRSYWDERSSTEYINLGGSEIYVLDGEEIRVVYNGEAEILFLNSEDSFSLPNLLEEDNIVNPWKMLVEDVNFLEGDTTVEQAKQLVMAYVCCMFFPEAMPTRPLLAILGSSGAGKTTTARRILWLIEGPQEDVLGQVPDKPDALRASMAAHRMIVLDNIERTDVKWLPDTLNRAATGSQLELRKLHTTNQIQKVKFNVFIGLTGTEIPFSEETVYTRILPIYLSKLDEYGSEGAMRSQIEDNFVAFWRGMLFELNKVVAELKKNKSLDFPSQTRLADYAVFCNRIKQVDFINEEELMKGLNNLVNRQKEALKEYSVFIPVLEGLIRTRPDEMSSSMGMAELFAKAQRYAVMNKQKFEWANAMALGKHIQMLEEPLKKFYGMSVRTEREGGKEIKKYKFAIPSTQKNNGNTNGQKTN